MTMITYIDPETRYSDATIMASFTSVVRFPKTQKPTLPRKPAAYLHKSTPFSRG